MVSSSAFLGLGQLTSLRLSSNRNLAWLEPGALEPLVSLRQLDLEQNRLTSLDLRPTTLEGLEVKLAGNPWLCNCSLYDLQEALKQQRTTTNSPIQCHQPEAAAGLSLLIIDLSHCPVSRRPAASNSLVTDHEFTVVIVLSVILVLLLALAGVLLFRYRRSLQRLFKRLRWGKHGAGGPESKLGAYGQEYQKSFIQHEEYFLSLARQQADYSGATVPVTEL